MNSFHRVGLIVPSSNTTMETEVPALFRARERARPEDRFAFHSARVRMQHVTPEELRAMNAQTERATTELADMRPNVVATACLVAIMAQGPGHHRVMQAEIESTLERERAPAPVVSSAPSCMRLMALEHARLGSSLRISRSSRGSSPTTSRTPVSRYATRSASTCRQSAVAALDLEDLKTHWRTPRPA
jgi:maleate isomerase